jgi:putative ABC transport system permease protein
VFRPIRTFLAVFVVAARRLWATRWLTLASAAGFVAIITLAFCVPLYADAVYHRILARELRLDSQGQSARRIPPFGFLFRFNVFWQEPAAWDDVMRADLFMEQRTPQALLLPRTTFARYFQSTNLRVYPADTTNWADLAKPLLLAPITSMSGFGDHVRLTQGRFPSDAGGGTPEQPATVEVLVSKSMADRVGFQVGDRYAALSGQGFQDAIAVPVVIAGIWEARDRYDSYWFYDPYLMEGMLIASEDSFLRVVGPRLKSNLAEAVWYMDFDGDGVRVWNADALAARIRGLADVAKAEGANISIAASPESDLARYQRDSQALTIQLFAFSIPLFVLALAFVVLVASLSAASQRNEIAVLRSRGATAWQVLGIAFLGACVLGGAALAAGAPIALGLVQVIGQARSFLNFVLDQPLPVAITSNNLPVALAAMAVTIVITVVPVLGAARHTIITYKQEQARALRPPAWQRLGLDILLLIPVAYWTYLLQRQGTVDIAALMTRPGSDPFSNPSLFLVPGLAMLAVVLLLLRALPLFLRMLAWLLGRLPGTAAVLAARELARSPGLYIAPLLLLTLTLSQAVYTASIAATLDQALDQQTNYTVGSDARLFEVGQDLRPPAAPGFAPAGQTGSFSAAGDSDSNAADPAEQAPAGPRWQFLPLSDYAAIDGVQAVARAGEYASVASFALSGAQRGRFLGIDRLDFPRVAYWRGDFSDIPLVSLMNALAGAPDAVLIPASVMKEQAIQTGDLVQVTIALPEGDLKLPLRVAGAFTLWPGWYPNKKDVGPLFVGNLDYLFEMAGGQAPHDLWVKVAPGHDPERVVRDLRNLDDSIGSWRTVRALVDREQTRPARQGLFGVLSIGFGGAALLTVAGFILYAVFSWRRRLIEMGVLRAIGLSTPQMALYLGVELTLLLGIGVLAGTAIGVGASRLYIPFLQVIATDEMRTLPFLVVLNWSSIAGIYATFVLLFVGALAGLVVFLRRLKIFQAVKLGETV